MVFAYNFMRNIAHHDHGQQPERMKFLRIIFGCPAGARKWRILFFAMLLHRKNTEQASPAHTTGNCTDSAVPAAAD